MKFETGLEQQFLENKKKSGKPLSFFEKYLDFNRRKVPEILDKRKIEQAEFEESTQSNIKEMEKAASEGQLVYKRK